MNVYVAGIPPHIDPAELVVTWRLRTHADMFSSSDGNALEPVSQSDTVASQQYEQYGQPSDDTGGDSGCMFTELLSAAELSATSSAQQVQRPSEQQNGMMPCIVPPGVVYPSSGSASMPFINQNGQLVFLPPAPPSATSLPLLQPALSSAGNANLSSAETAADSAERAAETDSDMPAVSSSTEEHPEPATVATAEETGLVVVEPADSSVTEPSSAAVNSKTDVPRCDGDGARQIVESVSGLDGIEPVSPAEEVVPDDTRAEASVHPSTQDHQTVTTDRSLLTSTQHPPVLNSGVVQQQRMQPFASHQQSMPMGMMPAVPSDGNIQGSSSMQGTLVLHNGQLLLVNQNQTAVGNSHLMPAGPAGVNTVSPAVPQNMAVSGSGAVFVNQFPSQPPPQQPAIAQPMPPLGPNQTVMVNTPSGPMTLNTVPSQPNQHPSALILPNGQIVPVVTQPNLLFPPQQCTPVTGGLLIPTPASQPMVNFVPQVSASPSFTTTPLPTPVVTVAAGNAPSAGVVRGVVQVSAGQQPGFPGSQPVQVGPGSVIQAVPAQGHVPVQVSTQSTVVSTAGPRPSVPNLPHTVMATMTPEGTIILTMPQLETQQKAGGKAKKSTLPRPLMPKPTITPVKTDGLTSCSAAATTLSFLTPARLPSINPPTSGIMPVVSGATYMVTNGPNIAGPNINLAQLPAATNNSSIAPLALSLTPDVVSQKSIEASKTTDILAKATESIFMLSPSSGDHLSPGVLCLNPPESQLQIDVERTMEHADQSVKYKSGSHSKKKPKMPVSLPPDHTEEIAADHSILDQLEGGEGEDEQSDINDFSDLIRLEPMTPRPATTVVKEASAEKSDEKVDSPENLADETVELVESCPTVAAAPPAEPDVPLLQDSDEEEVVEIDLTEEPISPEPDVEVHEEPEVAEVHEVVNEEASQAEDEIEEPARPVDDTELVSDNLNEAELEAEPLSSSSKTLFERLEEALMSSSTARSSSSSPTSEIALVSTTLTTNTSMHKSSRSLDKFSSAVVEETKGNESSATDSCSSSTVIDRIGKVLMLEKKSRSANHKIRKSLSVSESIKDDERNSSECALQNTSSTDTHVDQSKNEKSLSQVNCSNSPEKLNATVAVNRAAASEPVADKRHKRIRTSKEKLTEPAVTATQKPEEPVDSEVCETSDSGRPPLDVDAVSADGKHKGFALSNFLPESTKLNESTSAADLLEQSLCMASDDRHTPVKSRSLNASADEEEDVIISDQVSEPAEAPCMMEEATQTMRKELKKDKSKKQSHKSSCSGVSASEIPDTLTFNANELLNIVDVVENMAVETQTEKVKKSHRRKHKASSVTNGEMEIPSKRKKKSGSSNLKHANCDSDKVEKYHKDSTGIYSGERERHSKHRTEVRAAMAPKNDPMDVFNFTSDDIVPLDIVSSYSPYRNTAKKQADESSQGNTNTAKLPSSSFTTSKSSVSDKQLDNKTSSLSEPEGQCELTKTKMVPSENKENRGSHKRLGHGNDNEDVVQTAPQKPVQTLDMTDPEDLVSTASGDRQASEEVFSKSVTARHNNIATLARHVVPPKMHGSTPRSATKLSAQAARSRNEPEVSDNVSEIITIPSPRVPAVNDEPFQRQSSPCAESSSVNNQNIVDQNTPHLSSSSPTEFLNDENNKPLPVCKSSNSTETTSGYNSPVSSAAMSTVQICQSDAVVRTHGSQVTAVSSSVSSLSHVAALATLAATNGVVTDDTSEVHAGTSRSSCAVSQSDSQPFSADRNNPVRSCSRESSGTVVDAGSRSHTQNSTELREGIAAGYIEVDENVPGRSSSVSSQSDSIRCRTADMASYEHGPVERGYCENYAGGDVAVRSRSSGGSCSVESRSVSSAQGSMPCDRTVNSANVNNLNSSLSLRSNCSQKVSTSSDVRHSRSSGSSQGGSIYNGSMDCLAGTKHRSSCQEDSRQRQMMESEFFAPRAASSSSCAVQSNLASSVVEPFQYPYAAMTGAQPSSHHHEMSLASIAAAEYGFARNPFSSFPPPFGFDPQSSIRGPPGRFSPLSHNLPSCGVDKQTHKSATGNSMRSSGQESNSEMSKSRHHHQQQVCEILNIIRMHASILAVCILSGCIVINCVTFNSHFEVNHDLAIPVNYFLCLFRNFWDK